MSYAPHIIQIFGGSRKMARSLSVNGRKYSPSTVQSWKESGFIPAQHQSWVLRRARELGLPIQPEDFFNEAKGSGKRAKRLKNSTRRTPTKVNAALTQKGAQ